MTVVYCANKALYRQLLTSVNSLLQNNACVEKIYILIEDDGLACVHHPKINFINVNTFDFLIRGGFNCPNKFTYMALVRCFLTKILQEDKVLYLDVDTIVDGELTELWNIDIDKYCIAGRDENVGAVSNRFLPDGYINSGVLLMNLKRIKQLGLDNKLIKLLKTCHFQFPDQDAINLIFNNHKCFIPEKYNKIGGDSVYNEDIVIRHFAGRIKPWLKTASKKDKDIWDKYLVDSIIFGGYNDN